MAIASTYTATADSVFSGAGTNLWAGGTITINGSVTTTNSVLAGASLTGVGTISSQLAWVGGNFGPGGTLTLTTNSVLTMNGGDYLRIYGALTNAGTINWVGGALLIYNANGSYGYIGSINNLEGAVFNLECDQPILCACMGASISITRG